LPLLVCKIHLPIKYFIVKSTRTFLIIYEMASNKRAAVLSGLLGHRPTSAVLSDSAIAVEARNTAPTSTSLAQPEKLMRARNGIGHHASAVNHERSRKIGGPTWGKKVGGGLQGVGAEVETY
jgi:hypothetical protein